MSTEIEHTLNSEKWVQLYSDYLYNYTITRVNNKDLAKDLVQETFFAGLKSMKNFQGRASERTWLVSILKRKIIDYYRKINSRKGKAEVRMNFTRKGIIMANGSKKEFQTLGLMMLIKTLKMTN